LNILIYDFQIQQKEVLELHYWDYIYSKDRNCIISLATSTENFNKIPKGFLDIKIFKSDGTPIKDAYIRISAPDRFNEFMVNINAIGYYPVQINNVHLYPGLICKLNVHLESPQDEVRDLSLSLGITSPKDNLFYWYAEKFAEEVYALSDGKIKIEVFPDAVMGEDRQMIKSIIQNGSPDFIIQTTSQQVDFVPKLSVFDMPMVYNDIEDLRNTVDNDMFYEMISNAYGDAGYKLLGISDVFFRQMTSNKEIQGIDDFKGIKIRTMQNHIHEAFWESLGSIVTPLPVDLIYTSIKYGYIDAEENSYEVINSLKLYDIQNYIINTKHLPHIISLITSNKLYNSMTAAEKAIIDEAAIRATAYSREKADEIINEREKLLIDKGMTIIDLPEETKQAMRLVALPIYERVREIVDNDDLINFYYQNRNSF